MKKDISLIWNPLPGFKIPGTNEYMYMVSNTGIVESFRCKYSYHIPIYTNANGYEYFQFYVDKKRYTFTLHKAVMLAHVGPRPEGKEINHKDGNKQNNHLKNLEYCTRKQNMRHAFKTGLMKPRKGENSYLYQKTGHNHPKSTPINQYSLDGKLIRKWGSMNLVETKTDRKWKRPHLSSSIKNNKPAYGFIWRKA